MRSIALKEANTKEAMLEEKKGEKKISISTITRSFRKAGIITEQSNIDNSNEIDSDNDKTDPVMLDADIAQLLNSDTEDEEFDGFLEEE